MTERRPGSDRDLGLDRDIPRRDLLGGAGLGLAATSLGLAPALSACQGSGFPQDQPGYYPPTLSGLRGSHPGSFEAAHALRDGQAVARPTDTGETYDLVIVGAGLSGLSAAHFWRESHPHDRILILDNHDDFGGHAKRNEVNLRGETHLSNGGTLEIDSPRPYSPNADGLIRKLGVDPENFAKSYWDRDYYKKRGLSSAYFFDKETFGEDRLVNKSPDLRGGEVSPAELDAFVARTPLTRTAKTDLLRFVAGPHKIWPDLSPEARKDKLSRISYQAWLRDYLKLDPQVVALFNDATKGEWTTGIDAVSALDCWGFGYPGFAGLDIPPGPTSRMSFTPAGYCQGGSYVFHFPDGNATLARLLVRDLIPGSIGGKDAVDIVMARADYAKLDRSGNQVRIRLSSPVLKVTHSGPVSSAPSVDIVYARFGKLYGVRAKKVVMASWNMMIPYVVPELPQAQKAALHELVKDPLVYITVGLDRWTAYEKAGAHFIDAPNLYCNHNFLNQKLTMGDYHGPTDPDRPNLLHMARTPCSPGLPEHDQSRAGRAELLATSFETFEREIRGQLGRMLGSYGFDPARDISALIVNRWPHGYAPERNFLWEKEIPPDQTPQVVGRKRFGRIAIANSDCGGGAYTDVAIDMGRRAVDDLA